MLRVPGEISRARFPSPSFLPPFPLLVADIYHFSGRRDVFVGIERSGREELQKLIVQVSHCRCGSGNASSWRALSLPLLIVIIIDAILRQLRPPQTKKQTEETEVERRRRRGGGQRGRDGDARRWGVASQMQPDGVIDAILLLLLFLSGVQRLVYQGVQKGIL